jgi:RNA polymerase sigma-B factor
MVPTTAAAVPTDSRRHIDQLSDERATTLIMQLAELPAGHPTRPRLRDEAITAWLPMARRLARRYAGRGEAMDDLIQAATVGLIKSVDRFDESLGVHFTGYAIPTIVGELKRHFRDRTWSMRVPRRLQELRLSISEAANVLGQTLGRSPTVTDVAAYLGIGEEEVLEGLESARAYRASSLSTPIGSAGDRELGDNLGSEDDGFARADLQLSLGPAMQHLTDREKLIVMLRFHGNQTQIQIAERIGVSQMHVSRLLAGALVKLRHQLEPEGC